MEGRRGFFKELNMAVDETVAERETPEVFFERLGLPENPNDPRKH